MSNLTAIELIPNNSFATTGLFNQRFSTISANFAALNSDLTINFPSGDTLSVFSNIDASGNVHAGGQMGIGATPSAITTAVFTIAADSSKSDYIHFEDTSAARSNYVIGSRVGGTADGLGLYDLSGSTLIVNFSKQSVRFFAPVIGPAIDTGGQAFSVKGYGALGDGVTDDASAIQAAIDAVPAGGGAVLFPFGTYSVGTTIHLPTDRSITLFGTGGFATNSGGLISAGCVIKAGSLMSGSTLISQATTGLPRYGVQMHGLAIDGNDLTVHLLFLKRVGQAFIDDCTFFNSNGFGILCQNLENSTINACRFFELGNNTAYPNGNSSLALNSDGTRGSNTVFIVNCHWESGRGAFLTSEDTSGSAPIDIISIVGGKMEHQGNFHATAVDLPFVTPGNGSHWNVDGLMCINGNSQSATHLRIQSCSNSRFRTFHEVSSTFAAAKHPMRFVDVFSGDNIYVSGMYVRGASNNGEQIRVVASSCGSWMIDPSNVYVAPLSGGTHVRIVNPTVGSAAPLRTYQPTWVGSNGSAVDPQIAFESETSLGFYRSGVSALALSYGQFQLPAGAAVQPSLAFSSESSLGFYRSGASAVALSYGTLSAPMLMAGAGATTAPSITFSSNRSSGLVQVDGSGGGYTAVVGTGVVAAYIGGPGVIRMANNGSAIQPVWTWNSEASLGFFRSANSTLRQSYGTFWANGAIWSSSGISVGNGGTLIPAISSTSSLVGAFVVQPSASSFTHITWAAVQPGDHILTTIQPDAAASSMSSTIVLHSHCTVAGRFEMRLSNVSTLAQTQSQKTYYFTRISPF